MPRDLCCGNDTNTPFRNCFTFFADRNDWRIYVGQLVGAIDAREERSHETQQARETKATRRETTKNSRLFSRRPGRQWYPLSHLHHARFLVQGAEDRLPPLHPVGGLSGAPAALQLADVVPRPHARLPVFQAAQPSPCLEGRSLRALLSPARSGIAVLVVHVQHARLGVQLAEAPPRLAPVPERRVLVAERALADLGGGAVAVAARGTAAATAAAAAAARR